MQNIPEDKKIRIGENSEHIKGMTREILSLLSLAWLMSETPNLLPQEREAVSAGAGQKSHLPMIAEG